MSKEYIDDKLQKIQYTKFIESTLLNAGSTAMTYFGTTDVKYKKHALDVYSKADLESEKIILDAIYKNLPNHTIISEETASEEYYSQNTWIIDPLDGSRNFLRGTPYFAVMMALAENKKVIASGIYFPVLNKMYLAEEGKGAFCNGKPIRCCQDKSFERTLGAGFISVLGKRGPHMKRLLEHEHIYKFQMDNFGCSAANTMAAATGERDWFIQPYTGAVWDNASAYRILKEAGCVVTNFDGEEWTVKDLDMIAANPEMHKNIIDIIKEK